MEEGNSRTLVFLCDWWPFKRISRGRFHEDSKLDTELCSPIMNMEKATWLLSGAGFGGLCVSTQCMRKFKRCLRGRGEGTSERIKMRLLASEDRGSRIETGKIQFTFSSWRHVSFVFSRGIDSRDSCSVCNFREYRLEEICLFRWFFSLDAK